MNAYMNISVRVLSANAQARIKGLQAQVAGLQKQLVAANAASAAPGGIASPRSRKSLQAWGNQVQWTGRQLQYNWTIPIAIAGAASAKFALDNEKAFTRVKKVYGDATDAAQFFNKQAGKTPGAMYGQEKAAKSLESELGALEEAFVALSSRYGVQQKEVLETAGAWAAAGSSGRALAESTELSIKAMILGDMELAKATEALIAIQAQYGLNTKQLSLTLAELNAIENETGASMQDLITAFSKSAGVAREAGIDVRHLGAMIAALVPATGTASTAGNALKTIISRLMSPTQEATKVMKAFGVDTSTAAWNSATAMERLQVLAGHMGDSLKKAGKDSYVLSDSQKQVVATVLGSRWQMNRFLVLMRELGPEMSFFEKALESTSNRQRVFKQMTSELNAVLESSPQRLAIIWATLQNGLATAIQPMIPYLIYMAQQVADLVTWFNNLDPAVQKMSMVLLLMLAAVGPLVKYFGSLMTLLGTLAMPLKALLGAWVSYATVTSVVNGETVKTRRSFLKVAKTLLMMPFAWAAAKMWALVSGILAVTKALGIFALAQKTLGLAVGLGVAGMSAAWAVGSAAMVKAWQATWVAMTTLGAAGMAHLRGIMVAGSVLFSKQMFTPLIFAMGRAVMAVELLWIGMWVSLKAIMQTGQIALLATMSAFRATFLAGWAGIYLGMVTISTAGHRALIAGWTAFRTAMGALMVSFNMMMTRLWVTMHVAWAAISTKFWTAVLAIWFKGAAVLPLILTKTKRAVQAAWALIVAAQRTGALAAAAAAAGPWVAAAAAIIGVLYLFRDQIAKIWDNTVAYFADASNEMTQLVLRAWNALPQGVANALIAVANIVRDAAMQIYEWFSYINPFARHSPSLVDNVTSGMKVVGAQFGKAKRQIGGHLKGAYASIKAFGKATRKAMGGAASFEIGEDRKKVKKFAPGALGEFNRMSKHLRILNGDLARMEGRVAKQESVVDRWTNAVERANKALDKQQAKLDRLTAVQDKWQSKLDAAQERLSTFASAPITGMGAMSDKIFENEMAQKRLRLEMMKMEEVTGPLGDIEGKIAAINGAIELLRGEQSSLRAGGAGSEILSEYDDQIAALEEQKKQHTDTAESIGDMSSALDELQRKGEKLDLQNSLKFDPLTRQIDKAANALKEMPFDKIMAGVRGASSDMGRYQNKLDVATKAVDRQQKVIDRMTASRDKLQTRLDRESDKLDNLKGKYDDISEAISAIESAMNDVTGAADTMSSRAGKGIGDAAKKAKGLSKGALGGAAKGLSPAEENFMNAAGGNFAKVGGKGLPIRTDWSDQTKQIEDFTKMISDEAASAFDDISPFKAIKDKWGDFKSWWSGVWGSITSATNDMFSSMFSGVGGGGGAGGLVSGIKKAWAGFSGWFDDQVLDPIRSLWDLFGPDIMDMVDGVVSGFRKIWDQVGPEAARLIEEFSKMGPALRGVWNIIKIGAGIIAATLLPIIKVILSAIGKLVGPALEMIGGLVGGIIRVVTGIFQIISGFFMLFTSDWREGFKKIGAGILNMMAGLLEGIWSLIKGAVKGIVGVFWGIIEGIWEAAVWLWDVLFGNSIIPDIIDAFFWWFDKLVGVIKFVWRVFATPLIALFKVLFRTVIGALRLWWSGVTAAWSILTTLATWFWDNILKPIWSLVVGFWKNFIQPAFKLWWKGVKLAWKALTKIAKWLWKNVLKPVWKQVKDLWDDYVGPAFKAWWKDLKKKWNILKKVGKWLWDNVLKPAWKRVQDLWDNAGPELKAWWARIKKVWAILKRVGKWVWDNVLKPVWNKVKDLWVDVRSNLRDWWSGIKRVWNSLKGLGTWVWRNVMKPVFDKIKEVWNDIRDWLRNNKDMLTGPVKGIVNTVISAVNKIIGGLNKVAKVLPGVDWKISGIPKLAEGGPMDRRANRGFKTNGARAIVGEGKANYPEFVIPTDPTYRNRAKTLMVMAASKIGLGPGADLHGVMGDTPKDFKRVAQMNPTAAAGAIPEFGIGGFLKDKWNDAKKLADDIAKLPRKAVGKVMDPLLDAGRNKIRDVGWTPVESPPLYGIDKLEAWVKAADKVVKKQSKKHSAELPGGGGPAVERAFKWAKSQVGKPYHWGGVGPDGYDCSGFMSAITNVMRGQNPYSRVGATASFPWPGFKPGAQKKGFTIGSSSSYFGGVGHMAGTLGGVNVESSSGVGVRVGGGARGYSDPGFNQVYHLAKGAFVKARRGGVLANIGEGGYDEAVVPLPKGMRHDLIGASAGGEKHYHFYGDLSFPNIENGDDAQDFLDNLDSLAKD